jgi:hypothetical protein
VLASALDGGDLSASSTGSFILGIEPQYPWDMWLGGPQIQSKQLVKEKNLLPLSGIEPKLFGHRSRSLVFIPTLLFYCNFFRYGEYLKKMWAKDFELCAL